MTGAVDVGATVEAGSLVEIKLPRLRVVVEQRQAERLRDVLNTVLPEQIEDLMTDPRISDVDVLQAAQALLAERGQDTENLAVAIEHLKHAGELGGVPRARRQSTAKVARTLRLLTLWEYVDAEVSGPYETESERTEAAQDYRRAHGEEHGVYRMDVTGDVEADVLIEAFTDRELQMPEPPRGCTLCRCTAVGEVYGLPVCKYHTDHSEDDPRCPDCLPVAVGDRVRDPLDGEWREIVRIDGLADGGTCHLADGGCMSVDEAGAADKRLPSEGRS